MKYWVIESIVLLYGFLIIKVSAYHMNPTTFDAIQFSPVLRFIVKRHNFKISYALLIYLKIINIMLR